jgi:hypothetical protein
MSTTRCWFLFLNSSLNSNSIRTKKHGSLVLSSHATTTIVENSLENSPICSITWGSIQESVHSNVHSQIAKCASTSYPTRRSISLHTDAMICTFLALIAKLNLQRGRFSRISISAILTARFARTPTSNNLRNFKTKKKVTHYLISKSLIKLRLVI